MLQNIFMGLHIDAIKDCLSGYSFHEHNILDDEGVGVFYSAIQITYQHWEHKDKRTEPQWDVFFVLLLILKVNVG